MNLVLSAKKGKASVWTTLNNDSKEFAQLFSFSVTSINFFRVILLLSTLLR